MRSSTGRWVSGDDFFDREAELEMLEGLVREGNHVLLTGQRRMGKTSVVRELGRRLEAKGWVFVFVDIEGASCPEDAVAGIARAIHPVRPVAARFADGMKQWLGDNVEEISALDFGVKIRAGLNAGNWRRHGERLFGECAAQDRPFLMAIDEVPIFLKRMVQRDGDAQRADEFLSWLRGVLQEFGDESPVLVVSGSIGLEPLVRQLGIPDRINHLYPVRLGPWNRDTSAACFERLADSHGVPVDAGVPNAVYDMLGAGIPHHVQSFFARLRDTFRMEGWDKITVDAVREVYRNQLLGPSGQSDLVHYETRLENALEDESYGIAMEILAEAATQGVFTPAARLTLNSLYAEVVSDAGGRIADVLEVLVHDGYLESGDAGHRFSSRLLQDWWSVRFRDHHVAIQARGSGGGRKEET